MEAKLDRQRWEQQLRYWCEEADISPRAAEIETMAAEEGFMGEKIRLSERDCNFKFIGLYIN